MSSPVLGLVCLTEGPEVRYRALTRTRLLSFSQSERVRVLTDLYCENLSRLGAAIRYCRTHAIGLYRMPTGLLPFSDHEVGAPVVRESRVRGALAAAKRIIRDGGVRVVTHPDQFVVVSSDSDAVVRNSITLLTSEAALMDALGLPRSPHAAIILHGGKSGRSGPLVSRIKKLPPAIRSRLVLENDEHAYGAQDILEICGAAGIPMVFDAHHHLVKERLTSYEERSVAHFTARAARTWPDRALQLVHISNGREARLDRRHSDTITHMPPAFRRVPYIEIEAKAKERALFELRGWFPQRTSRP